MEKKKNVEMKMISKLKHRNVRSLFDTSFSLAHTPISRCAVKNKNLIVEIVIGE